MSLVFFFFFNDPATTEIYTLPLHDALPILASPEGLLVARQSDAKAIAVYNHTREPIYTIAVVKGSPIQKLEDLKGRSEEHTSELQSRQYLVCRLLLEKKKKHISRTAYMHHQ